MDIVAGQTVEVFGFLVTGTEPKLFDVPDHPGISARIFEAVASEGVLVDTIAQSIGRDGLADISFTVPRTSVEQARRVLKNLSAELGGEVKDEPAVAILTVKGIGIRSHTGVGLRMFKALAEAKINLELARLMMYKAAWAHDTFGGGPVAVYGSK